MRSEGLHQAAKPGTQVSKAALHGAEQSMWVQASEEFAQRARAAQQLVAKSAPKDAVHCLLGHCKDALV